MPETTLRNAIDGARLVEFHPSHAVFVAWHGGTTFNVYTAVNGNVREVDVFNVSDEKGRPVDYETAKEHAEEYHERHD